MTEQILMGGTFNLEFGRRPGTVQDEVRTLLAKHSLDFLCVQEAHDYYGQLNHLPGYTYVCDPTDPGTKQVGILVHQGLDVSKVVFRSFGDGWVTVGKKQHAPVPVPRFTLEGWLRVGATHMPTPLTWHGDRIEGPSERIDDYLAVAAKVKHFISWPRPAARLFAADWNEHPETAGKWAPGWIAAQAGARVAAPDVHAGHYKIDYPMWKGCTVTEITKDTALQQGSDHDPVIFKVIR